MKLTNKIYSILLILTVLFFTVSCEDYLQEESSKQIEQSYLYNNPDGLKSAVVGLYNFNRELYTKGGNHEVSLLLQSRADLTLPRGGEIGGYGKYVWATTDDGDGIWGVRDFWKLYNKIAAKATAVINAAQEIEGMDESDRIQVIAEA